MASSSVLPETVIAALNDPKRSIIGDPRQQQYAVSLVARNHEEAVALANVLEALRLTVQINYSRRGPGEARTGLVVIYGADDQKRLFDLLKGRLAAARADKFETLVLARGPIPQENLQRMRELWQEGWSYEQIANRLNEVGVIAGMGGLRWTDRKIKKALREPVSQAASDTSKPRVL